jgi:hypothetical protein
VVWNQQAARKILNARELSHCYSYVKDPMRIEIGSQLSESKSSEFRRITPLTRAVIIDTDMTGTVKIGLWTVLGGVLSVLGGMAGGFGPCGPSSILGMFLFFGGLLAALIGFVTVVVGLAWNATRCGSVQS